MSRKPKKATLCAASSLPKAANWTSAQGRTQRHSRCQPHRSQTRKRRLQDLGKELLTLRSDLFDAVGLPDKLVEAIVEAKRITNFEGKRRQMQYVGKLMRKLDPRLWKPYTALEEQHKGSATEKLRLHWPSNGATA